MTPLGHTSLPGLFFIFLTRLFNVDYSFFDFLVLVIFSNLPDLDFFLACLWQESQKRAASAFRLADFLTLILVAILPWGESFSQRLFGPKDLKQLPKHRLWFSHWPLLYSPLLLWLFFKPGLGIFLASLGIYSHFVLDTFSDGKIFWLAPFLRKPLTLFRRKERLKTRRGLDYFRAYHKSRLALLERLSFLLLLLLLGARFFY